MIAPEDAIQRAIEIHDSIYLDVHDDGATTEPDVAAIYLRLTDDYALVSERWNVEDPCVPYFVYRALRRFHENFREPMKHWLEQEAA